MVGRGRHIARGVTLVEVMALLIVVAIAVPPLAALSAQSSRALAEERRYFHSAWLATAVLEQIRADALSEDAAMSLEAMSDAAYLSAPATGLRDRLSETVSAYEDEGLSYEVTFDDVRDATGAAIGAGERSATRLVTVEVLYASQDGREIRAPFSTVVGAP